MQVACRKKGKASGRILLGWETSSARPARIAEAGEQSMGGLLPLSSLPVTTTPKGGPPGHDSAHRVSSRRKKEDTGDDHGRPTHASPDPGGVPGHRAPVRDQKRVP